ncbi:trypsin, alkaline B-like [Galleria mellonella]|uniref:Trypsin, alkaline B-like n=1 Tax=Galleria mellonella TaxID=7137 RepID=A0A6J3C0X9_GALME|nr:trypsin, alkaline B-like [Galleria mellonella]
MMWHILILFGTVLCSQAEDEVFKISVVTPSAGDDLEWPTNTRIIGGTDTTIERFPYIVQILINNSALQCGGSLITMRHVLSAAHCFWQGTGVTSPRYFTVRAGTNLFNSGGRAVSVSMIIIHERYNPSIHDNDVAVLVLSSTLRRSNQISTIGIPEPEYKIPDNSSVTYAGWGTVNPHVEQLPSILQEVTVLTINRAVCSDLYNQQQYITGYPLVITSNMICAGLLHVGGKDACQGDSGGPLIYNGVLVGITSWGYGCADGRFPGVSARVSSFTTWINATVTRYNGSAGLQGVATGLLLVALLVGTYQHYQLTL